MSLKQLSLDEIKKLHQEIIYTAVRIRAGRASGSGTVIFSGKNKKQEFETYILTANHVIDELCKVKGQWDPMLGKDVKKELRKKCDVDIFRWEKISDATGATSIEADIVARDRLMDVALLKLRTAKEITPVAKIFTDLLDEIKIGDEIIVCGATMGVPPLITKGTISLTNIEIDNYDYLLTTAPSYFGVSGGSTFRRDRENNNYELIGMPARISVNMMGLSPDPIVFMGYSVRIDNILKFLSRNCYNFIFDPTHTIEEDAERKRRKIEAERRKRALDEGFVSEEG